MLIYVATPLSGDFENNVKKAEERCKFIYSLGYTPVAPYLEYIRFLDDTNPQEREDGIKMGLKVLSTCDLAVFFGDKITTGMREELNHCLANDIPFVILNNALDCDKDNKTALLVKEVIVRAVKSIKGFTIDKNNR